jgi:hypothetical protein
MAAANSANSAAILTSERNLARGNVSSWSKCHRQDCKIFLAISSEKPLPNINPEDSLVPIQQMLVDLSKDKVDDYRVNRPNFA